MDRTAVRVETALGEDVREASMRLPERQREALALSGLERRSYEEIAAIMETSAGSVAQLISRARINLYDELRGTALASVATPSPDCERALPLIAARDDGQLGPAPDAAWLDVHLAGCDRCRLGAEQMREVNDAYRDGAPADAPEESSSGMPPANQSARSRVRLSRGRAALAGALGVLLLLGGLATAFVGDDGSPAPAMPAADAATGRGIEKPGLGAKPVTAGNGKHGAAKERAKALTTAGETNGEGASAADAVSTPVTVAAPPSTGGGAPSAPPSSGPTRPAGKTGVEPTKQTSAPKPTSKPKPAPTATPTSQPASGPTTTPTEAPPPAEEPPDGPGRSDEAPGKPSDRPSH